MIQEEKPMAEPFNHRAIEQKWRDKWEATPINVNDGKKPKYYCLDMFPYPSGSGLHVGHWRGYVISDVWSRYKMLHGYHIIHPMGWDAFGLPAENYAIKMGVHPAVSTAANIKNIKRQIKQIAAIYDWDMEVNTTDPEFYKWTQWIFLQMFKHGLAYKTTMPVNWCTSCKCVLANEEVVNGVCERCGSEVVHKVKSQWMLKITAYADKLIDGLDGLDYIERVSTQQKNWIGRSHGAEVNFGTTAGDTLTVYTTRCDTLFGATYMVVSPEHAMVKEWLEKGLLKNADAVTAYQAEAARKSDFERSELNKEKTGVKLEGVMGINPVNDKQIPIFISDYVLSTYGTGAIMAVPAHDTRDWEFAKKFGLPIIEVVKGNTESNLDEAAFTDVATGTLVNSGFLDGLTVKEAIPTMKKWVTEQGIGRPSTRAAIIETLFKRNYIRKERKNLYPTATGAELIGTIHEELLKSAELTGLWEKKLRQIERGTYEARTFLDELKQMVNEVVINVLSDQTRRTITIEDTSKAAKETPKDEPKEKKEKKPRKPRAKKEKEKEKAEATPELELPSTDKPVCPICHKGSILRGKTAYGCSEYKNGCTFRLDYATYGNNLTDEELGTVISKLKSI